MPPRPPHKIADPPTQFDANAGVNLPVNGSQTNMTGNPINPLITLHDRTAYYVGKPGVAAVDVLTGKQSWAIPG
jgi:hypothetical protein